MINTFTVPILTVLLLSTMANAGPPPPYDGGTLVMGTSTSNLSLHCPGRNAILSIWEAMDQCHALGGWLATPQSAEDDAAIVTLMSQLPDYSPGNNGASSDFTLLGGSDLAVEARWKWIDGPEKGRLFFVGDMINGHAVAGRYVSSQIEFESTTSGTSGDVMMLGAFVALGPSIWLDWASTESQRCYACQYQTCAILCNVTHTASFSGEWWPDCTCTCKAGWRGTRCDIQFTAHCTAGGNAVGNSATPVAECRSRGGYLAAPRSDTDDSALYSLGTTDPSVSNPSFLMLGGSDEAEEGVWRWLDGPEAGYVFWVGPGANFGGGPAPILPWRTSARYVGFPSWQPQNEPSGMSEDALVLFEWTDLAAVWGDFFYSAINVRCYACQYTSCSEVCIADNTETVVGYEWPNCTCQCKAGWGGSKCECRSDCHPIGTQSSHSNIYNMSCSCQCKPNYWGDYCNQTTTTPSITAATITVSVSSTNRTSATLSPTLSELSTISSSRQSLTSTNSVFLTVTDNSSNTTTSSISKTQKEMSSESQTVTNWKSTTNPFPSSTASTNERKTNTKTHIHSTTPATTGTSPDVSTTTTTTSMLTSAMTSLATAVTDPTTTGPQPTHPSIPINQSTMEAVTSELPLMDDHLQREGDIVNGFAVVIEALQPLVKMQALLLPRTTVPITKTTPRASGVTGNPGGFFSIHSNISVDVINTTHFRLTAEAAPRYQIDAPERLELYTTLVSMTSLSDEDMHTLLLVGTMLVEPDLSEAEPAVNTATTVVIGVGGMNGMVGELQALGALSMMDCADPKTAAAFNSYRTLAPTAIFESFAGAVLGNVALVAAAGIMQVAAVGVLRYFQRMTQLIDIMSQVRFPSLLILTACAFHTGTAFASAKLVSQSSLYEPWEVVVGALGFVYSIVFPIFLSVHPYLRIERVYQEYAVSEWLSTAHPKWPSWVWYVVPQGAIHSLQTQRAYGSYISSFRAPATQVWWTSMPAWTGTIIAAGSLFHPQTVAGCQALYVVMGIVFIAMGVVVVVLKPLRTGISNWISCASKVVFGLAMMCMAAALREEEGASVPATQAVVVFGALLMVVVVIQITVGLIVGYLTEGAMIRANVSLSLVWSHIPGAASKTTQAFMTSADEELLSVARHRTTNISDQSNSTPVSKESLLEISDKDVDDVVSDNSTDESSSSSATLSSTSSSSSSSGTSDNHPSTSADTPPHTSSTLLKEEATGSISSSSSQRGSDDEDSLL